MAKKKRVIFGTDGVRGKANRSPMTVEVAQALGRACAILFRNSNRKPRVVIGKDTRLSCYMFENALISGLCSMGVDTLMVGPLPTPGVAFITRAYRADAGVVISASHNPFTDNGIKFFSAEGYKFSDEWEENIEELIEKKSFDQHLPKDAEIGRNAKVNDADGRYIEFAKGTFPRKLNLRGIKIALDCANGAGYKVAPLIFKELDAEVISHGVTPNGLNINDNCGSLHPEVVQKITVENGADIGISLDGDADRVILVDEKGNILDGDVILAICAREFKNKKMLANNGIVSTVMSNLGFLKAMESLDIKVVQSQVGDRYVIQDMLENGFVLGGEQSGHIIFSEYNTTGDGLVTALQVLKIMIESGTKLSELSAFVTKFPQKCINVAVHSKPPFDTLPSVKKAIQNAENSLDKDGRILVRYSGTEMICRVMVEGKDIKKVDELVNEVAKEVKNSIGLKAKK